MVRCEKSEWSPLNGREHQDMKKRLKTINGSLINTMSFFNPFPHKERLFQTERVSRQQF